MKKAVKITIKGSVQGIFFRNFVKENANKLNLVGFVRNLDNGGVEIVTEGEVDDVDQICKLCEKGPKHAVIKSLTIKEVPFQDFKEFKILHI